MISRNGLILLLTLYASCIQKGDSAQDIVYVEAGASDTSLSCGQSVANPCGTIQAGLDAAASNAVVALMPGTYSGVGNEGLSNVDEDNSVDRDKSGLVLSGLGSADEVVIACAGVNRFLFAAANYVTGIRNMTIGGCQTPPAAGRLADPTDGVGGALFFLLSDVVLTDLEFEGNRAEMGGALAVKDSNVTLSGCMFTNNNATIFGGAIASDLSGLDVMYTDFTGNQVSGVAAFLQITVDVVGRGGALFASEGSFANLTHCTFTDNRALISGGGVHLQYLSNAHVDFCVFSHNSVKGSVDCVSETSCSIRGGGLYMEDINFLVTGTIFINNSVSTSTLNKFAEGGGVYASAILNRQAVIMGSQFYGNNAFSRGDNNAGGYGGAVVSNSVQLKISDCDFELNYVSAGGLFTEYSSNGGAIWISGSRRAIVTTSVFFSNRAVQGTAGAIYVTDAPDVLVENCTFSANIAQSSYVHKAEGGAIVASHNSYLTILRSSFLRNLAEPVYSRTPLTYSGSGGGIYIQSASANITGCKFSNNHVTTGQFDSGGSGGAISLVDSQLTHIVACTFILNSARGYAGAYSYSSSGTGGAISVMFSSAIVEASHFNYNWVSAGGTEYSLGGAMAIFYDNTNPGAVPVQITGSVFRGNIATGEICTNTVVYKAGEGGAISVFGSETLGVDIKDVLFIENVADTQSTLKTTSAFGGALMLSQSSSVRLYGCNFSSNVAHNGYAADISSITDSEESRIYLNLTDCYFEMAHTIDTVIDKILAKIPSLSCNGGSTPETVEATMTTEGQLGWSPRIAAARSRHIRAQFGWDRVEGVSERAGRHLSARQSVEYVRSRRLESTDDGDVNLLSVDASIIVGAGLTLFDNARFVGEYHIFAGNILTSVLEEEYSYYDIAHCAVTFAGSITGEGLNLIALKSDIVVGEERNSSRSLVLANLIMFNSSLEINYDINVTGLSVIMGTSITSNHFEDIDKSFDRSIPIPVLSYLGPLHSGFFDIADFGSQFQPFQNIETAIFSPDMYIDNVAVRVYDFYSMASTRIQASLPGRNSTSFVPDLNLHLLHYGSMEFLEHSKVHLSANLSVFDRSNISSCGLVNKGELILGKPQVSWKSVVTVKDGCYQQTKTGLLSVTVSSQANSRPLITTKSSSTIQGRVNVSLFLGNSTKLNLYGSNPSHWLLFGFEEDDGSNSDDLEIIAPIGLGFVTEVEKVVVEDQDAGRYSGGEDGVVRAVSDGHERRAGGAVLALRGTPSMTVPYGGGPDAHPVGAAPVKARSETVTGYKETLLLSEMACNQVSSYYVPDPGEQSVNCSVCLQNTSCGYCFNSDSCIMEGHGCSGDFENKDGNCCPEMCNDHGNCRSDLTCDCHFLYTTTSNCKEYSVYFYVIIFGCVFIVFFVLLSLRYYISYRRQKENVLEKLRKRLLSGEGSNDGKEGGFVTNHFLQNLQQDLILRDVFVNNDEIKLEEKIGEGSFGVVYKASFRGAQVAVKQMRSPVFLQLSENDIEEFRKEAYMMSRLRHPNIVLVMGVSVVEQEMAPPTSRSTAPLDPEDDFGMPKDKPKAVKSICIITEYLEQGSLADILYGPNKIAADMWSYELALVCALQAARGMLYLHSHSPPICHRDLKSSNLVVDDHWVVKVTDFGMSRMVPEKLQDIEIGLIADDSSNPEGAQDASEDRPSLDGSRLSFESIRESIADPRGGFNPMMTSNLGTTAWCAPELLASSNKTRYSVKVDVYSFGLVLWELWERKRPYEELYSRFDIIDAIRAGRRPPISASCPPALKSLIQRCWHGQPARRPTFSYIVRYLKDELARIKRQRLASSSSSGSSLRWTSTGGYTPPVHSGAASTDISPSPEVLNALHRDAGSSSDQGADSVDTEQRGSDWRRFLSSTDEPVPSTGTTPTGGQSWLVRGRQNSGASPQKSAPTGGGPGTWRDRYVMRFSGWQASRPDTGLPPSVSGGGTNQHRDRRSSSTTVPIPPVPARPPAKEEPTAAASPGSAGIVGGAFSSVRNILRTGTSPHGRDRLRSTGHMSARSIERERDREMEADGGRNLSGGVSLHSIEQVGNLNSVGEVQNVPSSRQNSKDGASPESVDRSRKRSVSC